MRRSVLMTCLVVLSVSGLGAQAQTPAKDDIIKQLMPEGPKTRSITGPRSRKIEVVAGQEEKVIEEVKNLPKIAIRVLFAIGSDRLTPEGEVALKPLGEALKDPKMADVRVLIGGHTDIVGSAEYNQVLSERRAASVKHYLIESYQIPVARLESMGFGFKNLADPKDPTGQVNRRVEVVNLSQ